LRTSEEERGFDEFVELEGAPGGVLGKDEEEFGEDLTVGGIGEALDVAAADAGGLGDGEVAVLLPLAVEDLDLHGVVDGRGGLGEFIDEVLTEAGVVAEADAHFLLADGGLDDVLPVGAEGDGAGLGGGGGVLAAHFVDGQQEGVEMLAGPCVLIIGALAEKLAVEDGDFVVLLAVGDGGEAGFLYDDGIKKTFGKDLLPAFLDMRGEESAKLAQGLVGSDSDVAHRNRANLSMACSRIGFSTA
jgi:hypothetical protein